MPPIITSGPISLSPSGAHVTSVTSPLGEILYVSSTSTFGEGNSIRGGVPIIAPWFGGLLDKQPSHGWARTSLWEVTEGEELSATLTNDGLELTMRAWPIESGFEMSLRLSNLTDSAEVVQLAFHPYFKVADVGNTQVHGFDGVDILDRRTDRVETQSGAITFEGLHDRVALGTPKAIIDDGQRTITVTGRGHDSTVVWNPGADTAAGMPDVGEGEWRDFVCVEPALLGAEQKGISVVPGESVEIGMTVAVDTTAGAFWEDTNPAG